MEGKEEGWKGKDPWLLRKQPLRVKSCIKHCFFFFRGGGEEKSKVKITGAH